MATQLTRHFTCRIRVLAAIFALIALYFAFREPSLKRARDQPDEQPSPLPLYTHTHAAQAWLQGARVVAKGWGEEVATLVLLLHLASQSSLCLAAIACWNEHLAPCVSWHSPRQSWPVPCSASQVPMSIRPSVPLSAPCF